MFGNQVAASASAGLTLAKIENSTILESLRTRTPLPLQIPFKAGDLITQTIYGVDSNDGEPMRRYKFPLPGQPALVQQVIDCPAVDTDGPASVQDLYISTVAPDGVVREHVVSSKFFRAWEKDETVDETLLAWFKSVANS